MRSKRCHFCQGILLILLLALRTFAQTVDAQGVDMKKTGQSTMNFLQVGVVPEATAVGDAYTALGEGIRSVFYNPAGLAEMNSRFEVFLSNTPWIADIHYMADAVAWNMGNAGVIGLTLLSVDYGDIIGTRLISVDEIATDELGYEETGLIEDVGAYAIGLAYARSITTAFKFGISMRSAAQQLGRSTLATGRKTNEHRLWVYDLGVKYYTPFKSFRFGMSIRNFANAVKYEEITTQLPLTFAVGGVIDLMDFITPGDGSSSLLASMEFSHPNNYTERLHMGLNYTFSNLVSVKAGYVTNHDVIGWSGGFGIQQNLMGITAQISYSYSNMDVFNDISRFALTLSF
jgi:hypothetical protein